MNESGRDAPSVGIIAIASLSGIAGPRYGLAVVPFTVVRGGVGEHLETSARTRMPGPT